ncbi:MAG: glycosyltransferase [Deltaproteobacteria bacterium]|nr:glycosyltransferase [Deltaproteobacteria bacterium]
MPHQYSDRHPLTWGALVPTFRRPQSLAASIAHILEQRRPPSQVVVIAADSDPQTDGDALRRWLGDRLDGVDFEFLRTPAGTCMQRNAGIERMRTDITLTVDDDIYFPPDAMTTAMAVFEADPQHRVGGVGGWQREGPQMRTYRDAALARLGLAPAVDPSAAVAPATSTPLHALRKLERGARSRARSAFWDLVFKYYMGDFFPAEEMTPPHPMPAALRDDPQLEATVWLAGGTCAFRTALLQRHHYNEMFTRYAPAEDIDISFRMSREACMVRHQGFWGWHTGEAGGRPNNGRMLFYTMLNLAYIGRTSMRMRPQLWHHFRRHQSRTRKAWATLGLLSGRGLEAYRGARLGGRAAEALFDAKDDDLGAVYEREAAAADARDYA